VFASFGMTGAHESYIPMFPSRFGSSLILSPITSTFLTLFDTKHELILDTKTRPLDQTSINGKVYWQSNHDSVIRMFHCLFIVFKNPLSIVLRYLPSSHDPVIRRFYCLFIVLKILLCLMPYNHSLWLYFRVSQKKPKTIEITYC
jgi:hypothetical protein